jgi:cytochrome c biogenesis protein CcmG, thiol:disulfide interchange protein DsbE
MKNYLLKIPFIFFFIVLLIFFYLLIIERDPANIPSALLNKKIQPFETISLFNSKKFISSDEFGKGIVLVNFFATWCKPCRDEHKFIKKFSEKKNLKIIGINYKDDSKKTIIWLKKLGNPYSSVAIDKKGEIAINWGVYGIPETFIVDSNGIIKFRYVGPITNKIYKKFNLLIDKIN